MLEICNRLVEVNGCIELDRCVLQTMKGLA